MGLDWSPAVLYYAHRWGHMMMTEHAQDAALGQIHRDGYRYLLMVDPWHDDLGFMNRWPWVGALAPHLYALGDSVERLPQTGLVTTYPNARLAARLHRAPSVAGAPRAIRCGSATLVRVGASGT